MQGSWHTAHICHLLPLCPFLHMNLNLTEFTFAPDPALHPPPFHKHRGRPVVSPPPLALKWSESRDLRGQRQNNQQQDGTSLPGSPLKLNGPTTRMKFSVAALFLLTLTLILTTTSAFQSSESTCPYRAAMRKGNRKAGIEVTPRVLSGVCHHPWGPLPLCMWDCCPQTLPFGSRAGLWSRSFRGLGSSRKLSQGYVSSNFDVRLLQGHVKPLGGEAKEVTEETIINVCSEEADKASG